MAYVKVASFNVLADSLAFNEFICEGGDNCSCNWNERGFKLIAILESMLESCDVVVTQEIDKFMWFYENLNNPGVGYILGQGEKDSSNIGVFYNASKVKLIQISSSSASTVCSNQLLPHIIPSSGYVRCEYNI